MKRDQLTSVYTEILNRFFSQGLDYGDFIKALSVILLSYWLYTWLVYTIPLIQILFQFPDMYMNKTLWLLAKTRTDNKYKATAQQELYSLAPGWEARTIWSEDITYSEGVKGENPGPPVALNKCVRRGV